MIICFFPFYTDSKSHHFLKNHEFFSKKNREIFQKITNFLKSRIFKITRFQKSRYFQKSRDFKITLFQKSRDFKITLFQKSRDFKITRFFTIPYYF